MEDDDVLLLEAKLVNAVDTETIDLKTFDRLADLLWDDTTGLQGFVL